MTCPPECQEHQKTQDESIGTLFRLAIPSWVRAIFITLLGSLFAFCGWLYANSAATYATKEDQKEIRSELRQELKEIQGKLDQIISRRTP